MLIFKHVKLNVALLMELSDLSKLIVKEMYLVLGVIFKMPDKKLHSDFESVNLLCNLASTAYCSTAAAFAVHCVFLYRHWSCSVLGLIVMATVFLCTSTHLRNRAIYLVPRIA